MYLIFTISRRAMIKSTISGDYHHSAITQSDPCIVSSFRILCFSQSRRLKSGAMLISSRARKSIKDVRIVTRNGERNYRIPIAGLLVVDKDRCALVVQ